MEAVAETKTKAGAIIMDGWAFRRADEHRRDGSGFGRGAELTVDVNHH